MSKSGLPAGGTTKFSPNFTSLMAMLNAAFGDVVVVTDSQSSSENRRGRNAFKSIRSKHTRFLYVINNIYQLRTTLCTLVRSKTPVRARVSWSSCSPGCSHPLWRWTSSTNTFRPKTSYPIQNQNIVKGVITYSLKVSIQHNIQHIKLVLSSYHIPVLSLWIYGGLY